jgi:hypothetical protein
MVGNLADEWADRTAVNLADEMVVRWGIAMVELTVAPMVVH